MDSLAQLDQKLIDWITTTVGGVEVTLAIPTDSPTKGDRGINLYLMELIPELVPRDSAQKRGKPPLKISCRYLVSAWDKGTKEEHDLLGKLAFETLQSRDYQMEKQPVSLDIWKSFGVNPRLSFTLSVPLWHEFSEPELPLVEEPIQLNNSPIKPLCGWIYGPNDIPLMGIRVSIPNLRRSTATGQDGQFIFSGVPTNPSFKTIVVTGKRRNKPIEINLDKAEKNDDGLVIRLQKKEI